MDETGKFGDGEKKQERYDEEQVKIAAFNREFRATVESLLHWRQILREAEGLDFEDELKYDADIKMARTHARREALHLLDMLKKDNDL